nr:unnamed protein product [Callosobruchus analis]
MHRDDKMHQGQLKYEFQGHFEVRGTTLVGRCELKRVGKNTITKAAKEQLRKWPTDWSLSVDLTGLLDALDDNDDDVDDIIDKRLVILLYLWHVLEIVLMSVIYLSVESMDTLHCYFCMSVESVDALLCYFCMIVESMDGLHRHCCVSVESMDALHCHCCVSVQSVEAFHCRCCKSVESMDALHCYFCMSALSLLYEC